MFPPSLPFVMLVEDSDDDAFFFARALKRCETSPSLLRVNDGAEAVRCLESFLDGRASRDGVSRPFLFLDLKLPMLSGFEIVQWLADRGALERFSISILTGSRGEADIARAKHLGVTDYFMKPISSETLCLRLKRPLPPRPLGLGSR